MKAKIKHIINNLAMEQSLSFTKLHKPCFLNEIEYYSARKKIPRSYFSESFYDLVVCAGLEPTTSWL